MLTTKRLVIWIAFLAVFAMAARISMDTDTWWHLRTGQWIVENRQIPRTDPFSYTRAGQPWEYPGWLAQAPMYVLYNLTGPAGMNLLTAVLVTLAFYFVWRTMSGGVFLRAFVMVLAAAASGVYWAARPYLVTFVLAAVFLYLLETYRRQADQAAFRKSLWMLPLMVVWANSHGGFAVGFLIWGVYWTDALLHWGFCMWRRTAGGEAADISRVGTQVKHLTWLGLLLAGAVCVNPYGVTMLAYPFKTVSIGALKDYIQEWQSPDFHSLQVQPFAWLLLLLPGVIGASRKRVLFTDFALAAGFAYMGLLAGRNIALFGLVAPMVLTRHADALLTAVSRRMGLRPLFQGAPSLAQVRLNWALFAVLLLALGAKLSLVLPEQANLDAFAKGLPLQAVTYIRENAPPGRLFNSYNWGGYLLWSLPEYPVFIDGRTDLYNDEIIQTWLKVVRAEDGWQQTLEAWDVHLILLEPSTPLTRVLGQEGWQVLHQDDVSILYGR